MKLLKLFGPGLICLFTCSPLFAADWEYFTMKGSECRIFTTRDQSRLIVPSNCFQISGKPYSGDLRISYRSYKDQADFILGDLNLRYEYDGTFRNLQSGGMFEIYVHAADKSAKPLTYAVNKKITIKFAIDPKFDVAGLEPFYFDPQTKKWRKTTRYGKTEEGNKTVSDKPQDLWQDDPRLADFANDDQWQRDDNFDGGCYTLSIPDRLDPTRLIDTVICPQNNNDLDYRYNNYLADQAYKTMQIDNMGLYNFDKIFNEENSVPMFVDLRTLDGKPFDLTDKLYVVYKNSNSVIYYYKQELDSNFSLIPRNDIKIFVRHTDGSISRVPENYMNNVQVATLRGKTLTLKFEKIKPSTLSKEAFAQAVGLKS